MAIHEKAKELGRLIGQSDEYKTLRRARQHLEEVPELGQQLDRLQRVAETLERKAMQGQEPPEEQVNEYESLLSTIQADARYQGLVAAQANFDKLMLKVNEQMVDGMRKGADSPIITLG